MKQALAVESSALVVARNREEMALAQASISNWLRKKVDGLKADCAELSAAVEHAKAHKWSTSTLRSRLNRDLATVKYYEKAIAAVDAGFTIVPEFPIEVFAVRVRSDKFKSVHDSNTYSTPRISQLNPSNLLEGEGEYKSSFPLAVTHDEKEKYKDSDGQMKERTRHHLETTGYTDIAFPLIAAKPAIMSAAAEAMSLRLFDEIGICPQSRKADPMIIGTIVGPKVGWSAKRMHFLITWFVDMKTL